MCLRVGYLNPGPVVGTFACWTGTTKYHYECHNQLIPDRDDHHERYCERCGEKVHRDVNACKNIRAAWTTFVTSGTRPDYLKRRQRL